MLFSPEIRHPTFLSTQYTHASTTRESRELHFHKAAIDWPDYLTLSDYVWNLFGCAQVNTIEFQKAMRQVFGTTRAWVPVDEDDLSNKDQIGMVDGAGDVFGNSD
jgi:hypothetical protein